MAELDAVIASLPEMAGLCDLVREPLRQDRRGLATGNFEFKLWPLLPLMACESICGKFEQALPVAAARQFLLAAADVFDDVEDADSPASMSARYGAPVATNVATTLVILAETAITRLATRGVASDTVIRASYLLNSYYLTACAGQHLDLAFNIDVADLEDAYLKMTAMKSGSQTECACHLGALLANANQDLIDKFSKFGNNIGMASQIANDIQGIVDGSDILKPKITLPVIFAWTQADQNGRKQLERTFRNSSNSSSDLSQVRETLFQCGAIQYALVKVEYYKQQARDTLSEVEDLGVNMERLKLFLE